MPDDAAVARRLHRRDAALTRVCSADQRTAVLLTKRLPHRADDGTVVGIIGVARDITERVALAEQIRRSENMFALAVEAMPVGVIVIDAHGDLTFANGAAQKIWGIPILEAGNVRWRKRRAWWKSSGEPVQPHEWASVRALVERVPQLGQLLDIEGFDGVRRTVRNSAVPIGAHGGVERAVIVIEDITERTRLEERLARRSRRPPSLPLRSRDSSSRSAGATR